MGTPEMKILIVLCYYVLSAVIALISFTLSTKNSEQFVSRLLDHFDCEMHGQDPENPMACDRNDFRQFSSPELAALVAALFSLFPVVNLVYVVNIKELKQKCKAYRLRRERNRNAKNIIRYR